MSLKPTEQNHKIVGIALSAEAWARHAIGSDKCSGPQGFEEFSSGEWHHHWHYRRINRMRPEFSPTEAVDEMSKYRESCIEDIIRTAKTLDEKVRRLQRMEEQMQDVIEESKTAETLKGDK